MNTAPDHYEVLGVARDATPDSIKKAYRQKSALYHPDRAEAGVSASERAYMADTMARINAAYEVLSDPERRAAYDAGDDDRGKALRDAAVEALADLFQEAIANPNVSNLVFWAVGQVRIRIRSAEAQMDEARMQIRHLQQRRKTVRVRKGSPNLVHAIIDAKVASLEATIRGNERMIEVAVEARKLLEDYEYVEGAVPPQAHDQTPLGDHTLYLGARSSMGRPIIERGTKR
jgi:DnaJ-class molecular chaperone